MQLCVKTQKSYATMKRLKKGGSKKDMMMVYKTYTDILALQLAICIRYFTQEICYLLSSTEAIFVGSNIVEKSVYPGFLMIVFSHKNDRLKIEVSNMNFLATEIIHIRKLIWMTHVSERQKFGCHCFNLSIRLIEFQRHRFS